MQVLSVVDARVCCLCSCTIFIFISANKLHINDVLTQMSILGPNESFVMAKDSAEERMKLFQAFC